MTYTVFHVKTLIKIEPPPPPNPIYNLTSKTYQMKMEKLNIMLFFNKTTTKVFFVWYIPGPPFGLIHKCSVEIVTCESCSFSQLELMKSMMSSEL